MSKQNRRRGAAVTEAAVFLPLVVMIGFVSIEFANGLYLRQSLTLGAYEAAMIVTDPGSSIEQANAVCAEILQARDITVYELQVQPDLNSEIAAGDFLTVTVTAPSTAYALGPGFFMHNRTITSSVTVARTP